MHSWNMSSIATTDVSFTRPATRLALPLHCCEQLCGHQAIHTFPQILSPEASGLPRLPDAHTQMSACCPCQSHAIMLRPKVESCKVGRKVQRRQENATKSLKGTTMLCRVQPPPARMHSMVHSTPVASGKRIASRMHLAQGQTPL